jgi:hypothetical protein
MTAEVDNCGSGVRLRGVCRSWHYSLSYFNSERKHVFYKALLAPSYLLASHTLAFNHTQSYYSAKPPKTTQQPFKMTFYHTAEDIRIDDGHILRARLQTGDGEWHDSEIDLNQHIGNIDGEFTPQHATRLHSVLTMLRPLHLGR